jgi:uncharacterized glyoxalase superfamily protein PhnB
MAKKAPRKIQARSRKSSAKARSKPAAKAARRPAASKAAVRPPATPKWKPAGTHDVIASLTFRDAAGAIVFYKQAFGAQERSRMMSPDGRSVWHAELKIGDSTIFLNDEMQGGPALVVAPGPNHKATVTMALYVPDCDAVFNRAVQSGARPAMPLTDMFWGDRMGTVTDPFGQVWMISTRVRQLTPEQMRKGGEEFAAQMAKQGGMKGAGTPEPQAGAWKPPTPTGAG